mgnify:CR=1 FL=1
MLYVYGNEELSVVCFLFSVRSVICWDGWFLFVSVL